MDTRHVPRAALVGLLLVAGCGGGGEPKSTTAPTAGGASGPPRAKRPLATAVQGFQTALRNGDCKSLAPYMLHSSTRGANVDPAHPPDAAECTVIEATRDRVLVDFRPLRSRQFGPVAIVEGDGRRARRGTVVGTVWAVDRDGSWKTDVWGTFSPQVGHRPSPAVDFAGAAARFVKVAARGDCGGFFRLVDPASRLLQSRRGDRARLCRDLAAAYMRRDSFLRDLADDRAAQPRKLGATPNLALYGLQLRSGRYVVLILLANARQSASGARLHDNPAVLDYLTVRK